MTYRDEIRPWAIFQRLPNGDSKCIYRFKSRTDADACTSILRQGGGKFEVVFDQTQGVTQG
ncbi:MAG: hypothetical protein HWQ35_00630 [Nostoc sp. NMS1]|uniref:hypothetical protein n=1 Tax=unclassified Nostoc TaxID=2593658 RepID=UPI0025ED069D|nr:MULTISPECIES: hypothetical protein [unclassified Nostoc]MBN3905130.1 hypothetical protein [Nostoc sp. NMS1]MBN3989234.1 hypothetical protein [Nostoc sp. NMS2]